VLNGIKINHSMRQTLINVRSRCGGSNYSTWTRVQVRHKSGARRTNYTSTPAYFIIDISVCATRAAEAMHARRRPHCAAIDTQTLAHAPVFRAKNA